MSDVFHPPYFAFYPDDFIVGTTDFTAEEAGAYILLICYAWSNGSVPRDFDKLARITHAQSPQRMGRIWKTLAPKFAEHPTDPEMMVQPTVERIRRKAEELSRKQAGNGKRGGRPRKPNGNPTETQAQSRDEAEKSLPNTKDYVSLRETAISSYPVFPKDVETLGGLALIFLARFANCHDPQKAKKHVGAYTGTLNIMRERGLSVAAAWTAFESAWKANAEAPLFGGRAKDALSFLTGYVARKVTAKANDRGDAMDRAIAEKQQRQGATA